MNIQDRVAIVTGGASGIGRATVVALAARGAQVVLVDVDAAGARRTMELAGGTVVFRHCDVANGGELAGTFDWTVERFGRVDIVANIAGVGGVDLLADNGGDWRRVIDIDLAAVIDSTRLAVRHMTSSGRGGVIVNMASQIGLYPMAAAPVYGAAKAGVVHFTRSLVYLANDANVRVNAICPELVDTPMAAVLGEDVMAELRDADKVLVPADIADCVIQLIEDDTRAGAVLEISKTTGATFVRHTIHQEE